MLRPKRVRGVLALVSLLALVAATQAGTGRGARSDGRYVVARGQTLSQVAARLGVSTASLARANGIADPNRVRAGQRLAVPSRQGARQGSAVKKSGAARPVAARVPQELRRYPRRLALMGHFDASARQYGVPPDLLKAMAWMESGWQNDKVSSTKAFGIGQLMPDTVTFVNDRLLGRRLDPRRPEHNIAMSARFLRYLLDQNGGNQAAAVGSYYQGLASLRRHGPLAVTQQYTASVHALRSKF